ncbi:glycosyltransferase, partial [Verrucomicrobiota bacterium]
MNNTPKILHIITRLDCGGSATDTIVTADLLRNHNFQTAIAFGPTRDPDNSVRDLLASRKTSCFYLPNLIRNPSPWRDFSALKDILKLLKKERFDLVHTHTSKAGTLGRLAAHRHGIPAVHTPHGHIYYGYFKPIVTAFYVSVERWMARYTARFISLTENETRESLERGIGRPGQYVTIPTGVPLATFNNIPGSMGEHFRKTLDIPPEAFVFLSVGRLVPVK